MHVNPSNDQDDDIMRPQGQAINALTDSGKRPFNPTGVSLRTLSRIAMSLTT